MKVAAFNGDYNALADLIRRSWAANKEASLDYTPEFLRSCFDYPGSSAEFAPTIYEQDRPTAFVAGFPRHIEWCGKPCDFLVSTLLTSAPENRGKRYGPRLWTELAYRSRAAGFDGIIGFSASGRDFNSGGCCADLSTGRIFSIEYRSALITKFARTLTSCLETDIDLFLQLANKAGMGAPFRRTWTRPEAEWQCREREGAVFATLRGAAGQGMATGYVVNTMPPNPVRALVVEDLFWDHLDADDRVLLLRDLMEQGGARGAEIASVTITGYTEYDCLKQLDYRPIRRRMDVWVTHWGPAAPEPVDRLYIDVL